MRKILLLGKLNSLIKDVERALSAHFYVQTPRELHHGQSDADVMTGCMFKAAV